jgi:transposase
MIIDVEPAEFKVLRNWKKDRSSFLLVHLKAEAIMLASKGVSTDIIADMVDRTPETVLEWLGAWNVSRLESVVTGHAGNQNAAKLTVEQKEQVKKVLATKPSENGIRAKFWDVPALEELLSIRFDVQYDSDSSLHLLLKFCGMSFKLPDPYDKRRDEEMVTKRMAEIKVQVTALLDEDYEVFCADEVRVEHEAETRRMWLPAGVRTKICVDRDKEAQSWFGALNLRTGKVQLERIEGQQNTEQTIHVLARLQRAYPGKKIVIVWDNASWHTSKELRKLFAEGQVFENITLIQLPPYAPDHNPVEHVWCHAKGAIANFQREDPVLTFSAFEDYVRGREFQYNFENLSTYGREPDLV